MCLCLQDGALDLLRELKNIKMSLETLQVSDSTRRDASHPPRRVHLKSDKTRQYLPELRLTTERVEAKHGPPAASHRTAGM